MKTTVKSTLTLGAVAGTAGILLALVFMTTKGKIDERAAATAKRALSVALPGFTLSEKPVEVPMDNSTFTYYEGTKDVDGVPVKGYAFIAESSGYSGTIRTMVGIDEKSIIQGIYILEQRETPGLGARAQEIRSRYTFADFITGKIGQDETKPWFQKQFESLTLDKPIKVVKRGDWNEGMKEELLAANEVSAITGATITTNAVKKGIEDAIVKFRKAVPVVQTDTADEGTEVTPK